MNNDLIMQAIKLAQDVDEYAPNTNIAVVLRALILEIRELRKELDEQTIKLKNATKSRKG